MLNPVETIDVGPFAYIKYCKVAATRKSDWLVDVAGCCVVGDEGRENEIEDQGQFPSARYDNVRG